MKQYEYYIRKLSITEEQFKECLHDDLYPIFKELTDSHFSPQLLVHRSGYLTGRIPPVCSKNGTKNRPRSELPVVNNVSMEDFLPDAECNRDSSGINTRDTSLENRKESNEQTHTLARE